MGITGSSSSGRPAMIRREVMIALRTCLTDLGQDDAHLGVDFGHIDRRKMRQPCSDFGGGLDQFTPQLGRPELG
jgi:hypothetical protein